MDATLKALQALIDEPPHPLIIATVTGGAVLGTFAIRFLYNGVSSRVRIRRLKARGIPIPKGHSLLFGHLPLLQSIQAKFPKGAAPAYFPRYISRHWKEFFPDAESHPALIYLDLWPVAPSMIHVLDPDLCAEFTQEKELPGGFRGWTMKPLTGGSDLLSLDGPPHKALRSLFTPAFSAKNLLSNLPAMLDSAKIFAQTLRDSAGPNGEWGDIFQMHDRVIRLTFDVIEKVALDLHLDEQKDPSDLQVAFRKQIGHVKFKNMKNTLERFTPGFRKDVARNQQEMDKILVPQIQSRIQSLVKGDVEKPSTIIDIAFNTIKNDALKRQTAVKETEIQSIMLAQIKTLLFAGNDTTAQAIGWCVYNMVKYPKALEKLRKEHDLVLGTDASKALDVLASDPQKMNELKYTLAFFKEGIRLNNIASAFRVGTPDCNFMVNGVSCPTDGFWLQGGAGTIGIREDLWPKVDEFLPERFLVPEGHELYPVKHAFRPFEFGSKNCIGREMAMMEIKLALVVLAREFEAINPWDEWDKQRGVDESDQTLDGERCYRWGPGLKDGLPTKVRIRQYPTAERPE